MQTTGQGYYIKFKAGLRNTTTTNNKKIKNIPITIYTSTEHIARNNGYDGATGVGIQLNNTEFYKGTDGISCTQSSGFLLNQTSMTYSLGYDGIWECELSNNICWDNNEYGAYMSISADWKLVAAIGLCVATAPAFSTAIPAITQILSNAQKVGIYGGK